MTRGFTNGCFDLLHPGHIHFLKRTCQFCTELIVALDTDRRVRELKGPMRPIDDWATRQSKLMDTDLVNMVIPFDTDAQLLALIKGIRPDILFKGTEYAGQPVIGAQFAGVLMLIDMLPGHSTTALVKG